MSAWITVHNSVSTSFGGFITIDGGPLSECIYILPRCDRFLSDLITQPDMIPGRIKNTVVGIRTIDLITKGLLVRDVIPECNDKHSLIH